MFVCMRVVRESVNGSQAPINIQNGTFMMLFVDLLQNSFERTLG